MVVVVLIFRAGAYSLILYAISSFTWDGFVHSLCVRRFMMCLLPIDLDVDAVPPIK